MPTSQFGPEGALLQGRERERFSAELFDHLAPKYNRMNRLISWGSDDRWRRTAIAMCGLKPGDTVVDLGTGTADLLILAHRAVGPTGRVIGLDISPKMLAAARERVARELPGVEPNLAVGRADETGLPSASADLVMMGWVLRNIGDRPAVYAEILRILKPGGRFMCIETSRPTFLPFRWGNALYVRWIMPNLARLAGGDRRAYQYLASSAGKFPDREELAAEWRTAGFRDVQSRPLMLGSIAIHVGVR